MPGRGGALVAAHNNNADADRRSDGRHTPDEAGRPLELEAVVGAVLEVGARLEIPMPHTRTVYACTKLLAESRTPAR